MHRLISLLCVHELHVSGGSWSQSTTGELIRRDTHDDDVPDAVFGLIPLALARCPNVEAVIFERLGGTVRHSPARAAFQRDYRKVKSLIEQCCP